MCSLTQFQEQPAASQYLSVYTIKSLIIPTETEAEQVSNTERLACGPKALTEMPDFMRPACCRDCSMMAVTSVFGDAFRLHSNKVGGESAHAFSMDVSEFW